MCFAILLGLTGLRPYLQLQPYSDSTVGDSLQEMKRFTFCSTAVAKARGVQFKVQRPLCFCASTHGYQVNVQPCYCSLASCISTSSRAMGWGGAKTPSHPWFPLTIWMLGTWAPFTNLFTGDHKSEDRGVGRPTGRFLLGSTRPSEGLLLEDRLT